MTALLLAHLYWLPLPPPLFPRPVSPFLLPPLPLPSLLLQLPLLPPLPSLLRR